MSSTRSGIASAPTFWGPEGMTFPFDAVSPVMASAHPGHGIEGGTSAWHYLVEPLHGGALLVLLAALAAYRLVRRTTR